MTGYTPLFGSLTTGTLCGKWPDIGLWPIILSMSDRHGVVDVTAAYISSVTGLELDEVVACMKRFCEPDQYSRTTEHDGRRLELIDPARPWGWRIVNHGKYREKARLQSKDAARTQSGEDAERKRRARAAQNGDVPRRPPVSPAGPLSDSDTDSDTEEPPVVPLASRPSPSREEEVFGTLPEGLNRKAFDRWCTYLGTKGKAPNYLTKQGIARRMVAMGNEEAQERAVEHCVTNGWFNLHRPKDDVSGGPAGKSKFTRKTAAQLEAEARARGEDPDAE